MILKNDFYNIKLGQNVIFRYDLVQLWFYIVLFRYMFCNQNDVIVCVIDYGCVIMDILVFDKEGVVFDVSLGYDFV